jgi:hypothetical protein
MTLGPQPQMKIEEDSWGKSPPNPLFSEELYGVVSGLLLRRAD